MVVRNWQNTVPVVAIFMKFDDLITQVFDRKKDKKENMKNALDTLEKKFKQPLSRYKFHPQAYVRFEGRSIVILQLILGLMPHLAIHKEEGDHQEQIRELIKQTAASIDNLALKMLFVTVQQNNLHVCIEHAVNRYISQSSTLAATYQSLQSYLWVRHYNGTVLCKFWVCHYWRE